MPKGFVASRPYGWEVVDVMVDEIRPARRSHPVQYFRFADVLRSELPAVGEVWDRLVAGADGHLLGG